MPPLPTVETILTRQDDIDAIKNGLKKYGRVIVKGPPGIGKSVLVGSYHDIYAEQYAQTRYVSGYDLQRGTTLKLIRDDLGKSKQSLLVVDGFDEIIFPDAKENLLRIFKEGRKYGMDILMTSREHSGLKKFEEQSWVYELAGLSEADAESLFSRLQEHYNVSRHELTAFGNIIKKFRSSPAAIQELIELFEISKNFRQEVAKPIDTGIHYESQIFKQKGGSKILTAEQKEIIRDVKVINRDFVELVRRDPSAMRKLSSRQFEELAAELYEKQGYSVVLTKKTRDGGRDLIITHKCNLGDLLIYGECKRNRWDRAVDVNVVRNLHSVVVTGKATAGVILTTSYFSTDAQGYAENIKHQMSLVDFVKLNKMIEELK